MTFLFHVSAAHAHTNIYAGSQRLTPALEMLQKEGGLEEMGGPNVVKFMNEKLMPTIAHIKVGSTELDEKIMLSENEARRYVLQQRAEQLDMKMNLFQDQVAKVTEWLLVYTREVKEVYEKSRDETNDLIATAQAWNRWKSVGDFVKMRVLSVEDALGLEPGANPDSASEEMISLLNEARELVRTCFTPLPH